MKTNQRIVKIKLNRMKEISSEKLHPIKFKMDLIKLIKEYNRLLIKLSQTLRRPTKVITVTIDNPRRVYRLDFPWSHTLQRHINFKDLADVFTVYEAKHFTQYKLPPILGYNRYGNVFWVEHSVGKFILKAIWKDQYEKLMPWFKQFIRNGPRVLRERPGYVYAFVRTKDVRLLQNKDLSCVLLHKIGYTRRSIDQRLNEIS